jgi:hypothetical protein
MRLIEIDEGLERQCLEDIRRAATHLRDTMDDLIRKVAADPEGINGLGEVQDMGWRVDLACARFGLLRRLARGAGERLPTP